MPKLEYFLVAESVSIDQASNSLSLFHVLEEVHSLGLPVLVPRMTAVSTWLVSPEEFGQDFQSTLVVHRPDGSQFHEFKLNFTARSARHRLITNFERFPIDASGEWRFELQLDGAHAASHHMSVLSGEASRIERPIEVSVPPPAAGGSSS